MNFSIVKTFFNKRNKKMQEKIKKIILYTIFGFLLFTLFYNWISTFVNFWLWTKINPSIIPIIRDWFWFGFVFLVWLFNIKNLYIFIKKNIFLIFLCIVFLWLGLGSSLFYYNQSINQIFVWIKSSILPIIVFLSAIFVWNIIQNTQKTYENKIQTTLQEKIYLFIKIFIIWWFLWQLWKILFPDFFYSIWYWPVWDWIYNSNPPIYYRTWPWWWMRFSWLFAWPNNYWYLLILLLPFVFQIVYKRRKKIDFLIFFLFVVSGVLTMSRWVLLGWTVQIVIFVIQIAKKNKDFIKKNIKKILWLTILSVLFFVFLSVKKIWSTIEHFDKREKWRNYIIQKPILWYGLWTSWPAFHIWGEIIPENFFFQIWIKKEVIKPKY